MAGIERAVGLKPRAFSKSDVHFLGYVLCPGIITNIQQRGLMLLVMKYDTSCPAYHKDASICFNPIFISKTHRSGSHAGLSICLLQHLSATKEQLVLKGFANDCSPYRHVLLSAIILEIDKIQPPLIVSWMECGSKILPSLPHILSPLGETP